MVFTPGSGIAPDTPSTSAATSAEKRQQIIDEAHQRSAACGLVESEKPDFTLVAAQNLKQTIEQNRDLHTYATPVMETLYEQIINTHNMVILTDNTGLIIHTIGDSDFLEKANRVALQPGAAWSEQCKGTNAIGTSLSEEAPVLVHANEHYLRANHFLTCSAAPIFDHRHKVVGVLDVTGDQRSFHRHTMALVRMSAQMIENQLFSAAFQDAITVHFHSRPEFIGTLMEGIASFAPGGRFLSANRSGLLQLGLPHSALGTHTFSSLFGLPLSGLFDHYRTSAPNLLSMCLHNGVRVYARAEVRIAHGVFHSTSETVSPTETARPTPSADEAALPRRLSNLRYLNTGDPQIAVVIDKVAKVIGHDIPILIMGETGTGKELLAQAIHNDSPRSNGPFVAVNCASIPETLIESELFGYEDGAFTGARRKGNAGKILQANGGSLFLDEIGDMPLNLQARLLRVLQERTVTQLGSAKSIPIDVALICATNRNLRDLIARNAFREDLYYRINGLVVKLPPLRERTDLERVIERLLSCESHGARDGVRRTASAELMEVFKRYKWPGNFRQLTNVLRTAIIMAGDEPEIRLEHMPEDLVEDIVAMTASTTATSLSGSRSEVTARPVPPGGTLEDIELTMMRKALEEHRGNVSAAARSLGISRNTMYRKMNL